MGSNKSGKRKAQPVAPPKTLPAQGTGGKKRMPQSAFDGAAGEDTYEPERIVAERLAKGVTLEGPCTQTGCCAGSPTSTRR